MNWAKSRSTASKFEKQMRYSISWAVNTIQNGFGRAENVCPKQLSSLKPCWVAFDNITLLFSAWVTTSAVARCPRLQRRQSSHKVADTEAKVLWHHRLDVWVKQNSGSFSSTLKRRVAGPTPLDLSAAERLQSTGLLHSPKRPKQGCSFPHFTSESSAEKSFQGAMEPWKDTQILHFGHVPVPASLKPLKTLRHNVHQCPSNIAFWKSMSLTQNLLQFVCLFCQDAKKLF